MNRICLSCLLICIWFNLRSQSEDCYRQFLLAGIRAWDQAKYTRAQDYFSAATRCQDKPLKDSSKIYLLHVQQHVSFKEQLQAIIPIQAVGDNLLNARLYQGAIQNYKKAWQMTDGVYSALQGSFFRSAEALKVEVANTKEEIETALQISDSLYQEFKRDSIRSKRYQEVLIVGDSVRDKGIEYYRVAASIYRTALSIDSTAKGKEGVMYKLYGLRAKAEGCLTVSDKSDACFQRFNYAHSYVAIAELDRQLLSLKSGSSDIIGKESLQSKIDIGLLKDPNCYPYETLHGQKIDPLVLLLVQQQHRRYFGPWEFTLSYNSRHLPAIQMEYEHQDASGVRQTGTIGSKPFGEDGASPYLDRINRILSNVQIGFAYRFLNRFQFGVEFSRSFGAGNLAFDLQPQWDGVPMGNYFPNGLQEYNYVFSAAKTWSLPLKLIWDVRNENQNRDSKKRIVQPQLMLGLEARSGSLKYQVQELERAPSGQPLAYHAISEGMTYDETVWNVQLGTRIRIKSIKRSYLFIEAYYSSPLTNTDLRLSPETLLLDTNFEQVSGLPYGWLNDFETSMNLFRASYSLRIGYVYRFSRRRNPV